MLILKPEITVQWSKGVSVKARGLLFIDATLDTISKGMKADITVSVTIFGTGEPNVLITCTEGNSYGEGISNAILKHIPGAMGAVNTWIDNYNLTAIWEEEVSEYNALMELVDLPDVDITEGDRQAWFKLSIEPSGKYSLPTIEVTIGIGKKLIYAKGGAWVYLQLDTGETDDNWDKIMCSVCSYYLDLPITMDTLKASIAIRFQQYVNSLQAHVPIEGDTSC